MPHPTTSDNPKVPPGQVERRAWESDIEITPQMVSVGVSRLDALFDLADAAFVVSEVYKAMAHISSLPASRKKRKNLVLADSSQ